MLCWNHRLFQNGDIFTSTIGNINFYTAYVAMILGVAAAWFAINGFSSLQNVEKRRNKTLYNRLLLCHNLLYYTGGG